MARMLPCTANGGDQVLADTRNKAPVFPDQDDEMEGSQPDRSGLSSVKTSLQLGGALPQLLWSDTDAR